MMLPLDAAPFDATDGDTTHKFIVVDGGYQHLEGCVQIDFGSGDVVQDGLEQRLQVGAHDIGVLGGHTGAGGTEQDGRIQLFLVGVQIQQQLQDFVDDLVDTLVGTVDLIDHDDDAVAQLQGTAEDETGLRHGAFRSVYQQDNAVDHLQDAFHFAAEVRMARSIHNVDLGIAIGDGGVLSQDGDATFPFQVTGVHHALYHCLVISVHTALLEHGIH